METKPESDNQIFFY